MGALPDSMNTANRYVGALESDLESLPPRVTRGSTLPVARWAENGFAAIMAIEDCDHDPACPTHEHYVAINYVYERTDGGWQLPTESSGTDWPGGTSTVAGLAPGETQLGRGVTVQPSGHRYRTVSGFVGASAAYIELDMPSAVVRREVAPSGAVIVVVDGACEVGEVRVVDDHAHVLARTEI